MTKPRDFKYNSDYMSMGQSENVRTFTASVPQGTYQVSGGIIQPLIDQLSFNIPATKGAVEEYVLEYGGNKFNARSLSILPTASTGVNSGNSYVLAWRLNETTVRITIARIHRNASVITPDPAPAISLNVRLVTFRPPNLT